LKSPASAGFFALGTMKIKATPMHQGGFEKKATNYLFSFTAGTIDLASSAPSSDSIKPMLALSPLAPPSAVVGIVGCKCQAHQQRIGEAKLG
jgi:hypothetical protein